MVQEVYRIFIKNQESDCFVGGPGCSEEFESGDPDLLLVRRD